MMRARLEGAPIFEEYRELLPQRDLRLDLYNRDGERWLVESCVIAPGAKVRITAYFLVPTRKRACQGR